MDPFYVVRPAGDALENFRHRVQHEDFGHRSMAGDSLCRARRALLTAAGLLTDTQQAILNELFSDERHIEVEATWDVYQDMITAYREKDRGPGKFFLQPTIHRITAHVPPDLVEARKLARTLQQRSADFLSYL